MKNQAFQNNYPQEEKYPSILPVAEEKNSNINIYNNQPIICKDSPFGSLQGSTIKYPNEKDPSIKDQSDANSKFSDENSEENYKKLKRNELINYVSEPYYENNREYRVQHKVQKRKNNFDENNRKKKESPENSNEDKRQKTKKINVQINKNEGLNNNYRYNSTNNSKNFNYNSNYSKGTKINNNEYIYYNEYSKNYDENSLSNVSFSNKNIDTNNYYHRHKKQKNPNDRVNQDKSRTENDKIIKRLQKEKENLKKENKKLNKDFSNLEKERQKFENEKKLFFESRNRVIDDSRKNEERLIKLENELQNKFMEKKMKYRK